MAFYYFGRGLLNRNSIEDREYQMSIRLFPLLAIVFLILILDAVYSKYWVLHMILCSIITIVSLMVLFHYYDFCELLYSLKKMLRNESNTE